MGSSNPDPKVTRTSKFYLMGGGISSLATAVFLIRDCNVAGERIFIIEKDTRMGGCLDGAGSVERGFVTRGGRMFEKNFVCTFDLLSSIPSLEKPDLSVKDEIIQFNRNVSSSAKCRVVQSGQKQDLNSYGLTIQHKLDVVRLILFPEGQTNMRIDQWFPASFLETPFWTLWSTTFAFQPWNSVDELRRYFLRFIQMLPGFRELKDVLRMPYNQYDSLIRPILHWLQTKNVQFLDNSEVVDVRFSGTKRRKFASAISVQTNGVVREFAIKKIDRLFLTNGSMVEGSTEGSMAKAPPSPGTELTGSWALWKKIASESPQFGRPEPFIKKIESSQWISFTVTQTSPQFFDFMERFSGNRAGEGGLVTISDSNWLLSFVLFHQPHFTNQPPDTYVFWGYGLYPDRTGNFVKKPMLDCSGSEILTELLSHMRAPDLPGIVNISNCIPTLMPYITSQFMPREPGDRPDVVPDCAGNFAFLGQFCEIPDDVVFTVEYSVRSAAMAVRGLVNPERIVPPVVKEDLEFTVGDLGLALDGMSILERPVGELEEKGFIGDFYHDDRQVPHRTIIILGGVEGGVPWNNGPGKKQIDELVEMGYAVLCLAYYKVAGLPQSLENIPLEYFDGVFEWLARNPFVVPGEYALFGESKGAELALLVASRNPEIKLLIATSPSSVVFQGIPNGYYLPSSSWSSEGRPLPCVEYARFSFLLARCVLTGEFKELFEKALTNEQMVEKAAIPVEQINGPILLLSGKRDKILPGTFMARQIIHRLEKHGFAHPYNHIAFEKGHFGLFFREIAHEFLHQHFAPSWETNRETATSGHL